MDQVKIGAFIAQLRREKDWTQEELGQRVGVTNKTVSRWENGNYMPSIEILSLLSGEFGVSLTELVQGQRLEGDDFRAAADQNLASALDRPFDRFRQWLSRNLAAVITVSIVIFLLWAVGVNNLRYREAHPEDVSVPGTFIFRPENPMAGFYLTFDHDGRYYLFTPAGEYLEIGYYVQNGDIITVDSGEGIRWMVVKGETLYDRSPDGAHMLTYKWISKVALFIADTEGNVPQIPGSIY